MTYDCCLDLSYLFLRREVMIGVELNLNGPLMDDLHLPIDLNGEKGIQLSDTRCLKAR